MGGLGDWCAPKMRSKHRTCVALAVAAMATGPALADSIFSGFERNNVNEVTGAKLTLPASIPPFGISCVAEYPARPYRLTLLLDPTLSSYKEIDRSDTADPDNPQVWEGRLASVGVAVYFPTIDGVKTIGFAIRRADINGGLMRTGENGWSYWRNKMLYDCVGLQEDGQLPSNLVEEMKREASTTALPGAGAAASIPALCVNITSQSFPSRAALRQAHVLCDRYIVQPRKTRP
jgi:hypothetical protein